MYISPKIVERRQCPPVFQDRLNRIFGLNKYGDPLFKIAWGQSEFHRMGNVWRDKKGNERKGYRQRYLCDGMPCWNILRWMPPKKFLSPRAFYANTFDELSGLYIMGEYPWRGRYEVITPLSRKEVINGRLVIDYLPLTHVIIDKIIPQLRMIERLSWEERQALDRAAYLERHRKETEELADIMEANMPAFWGPVSFNRQGIRTDLLTRKMDQIQKRWSHIFKGRSKPPAVRKGFQVEQQRGNTPKRFFQA